MCPRCPIVQRAGTGWLIIQPPCHSAPSNRKIPAAIVFSLAWISNHQEAQNLAALIYLLGPPSIISESRFLVDRTHPCCRRLAHVYRGHLQAPYHLLLIPPSPSAPTRYRWISRFGASARWLGPGLQDSNLLVVQRSSSSPDAKLYKITFD